MKTTQPGKKYYRLRINRVAHVPGTGYKPHSQKKARNRLESAGNRFLSEVGENDPSRITAMRLLPLAQKGSLVMSEVAARSAFIPEKVTLTAPPERGELLRGRRPIRDYLAILLDDDTLQERCVARWLSEKQLPARKLGGRYVTTRSELVRFFMTDRSDRAK